MRSYDGEAAGDLRLYEYDPEGRLVRVILRRQSGGESIEETYEYDACGRKKKTLYVDQTSQRPNTTYAWGVEKAIGCYSAPCAAMLITLHDDQERPVELAFYDKSSSMLRRVSFGYDQEGHLVEEDRANTAEPLPLELPAQLTAAQQEAVRALFGLGGEPARMTHRYNRQGQRIGTRSGFGLLSADCQTFEYDERGDQIREVSEHVDRDYGMDDEGRLSDAPTRESANRTETRFLYEYDAHGNWVEKTVQSRSGTEQDFTLSSVERRTIEYFE